ncbi:MAG: hypothetical protein ACHRHE_07290 [Tepidisphaerales bacterium]
MLLYIVKLRLGESNLYSTVFLHHRRQFNKKELDAMVADAVNNMHMPHSDPMKDQEPNSSLAQINEKLFGRDVGFVEKALKTKYGFESFKTTVAEASIKPTLTGVR